MSMRDTLGEDKPTSSSRLVEDSGWIICGGFATSGIPAAWVSVRSRPDGLGRSECRV